MDGDRGNRLDPPRTHHARTALLRLRAAMERIVGALPDGAGRTVLDVGCGNMPYRPLFEQRRWRYVGADFEANPDAAVRLRDDGTLPPDAGRHALACSSQVLEHVADPHAYLVQLRGALAAGGTLVLSTHGTWPYHPDPSDYWRWTAAGLRLQLERAGFSVRTIDGLLGPVATGAQLVTSSCAARLPPPVSRAWCAVMQPAIALADWLDAPAARAEDAAIYVVVATDGER